MTVFVDDMYRYAYGKLGRMKMSHMYADTHEELMDMAREINLQTKWIQHPGDPKREHFDISLTKRRLAVFSGAVEVELRHWAKFAQNRAKEKIPR